MSGLKVTRIATAGQELAGGYALDATYAGDDADITTGLPIDGLLDVNAPAPDDQDVLTWDDAAGEWIAAPGGGVGGPDVVLVTVAATGATETIDVSVARTYDLTLTADCTLTLTGAVAAEAWWVTLLIRQDGTGGWDVTWPGSVEWPTGGAPTIDPDPNALTAVTLGTVDGGTVWLGFPTGAAAAAGSLPWYDVKVDGTAVGDGVTDDTAAIQDAIDTATASGTQSATIYFPPGVYLIGGALQDTGAFNGQIIFPDVSHTAQPTVTITLVGAMRPPMHPLYGASLPADGHTVLKSTLTGASGTAAVFSGGNRTPSATNGNNLTVNLWNLTLLVPDNPTLSGFNLIDCQGGDLRSVQVSSPGGFTGSLSEPTNSNSYGIKLPAKYWSNSTMLWDVSVGSTYTCILMGELTRMHGGIFGNCKVVLEFPDVFYPSEVHGMTSTSFATGIKGTGSHGITITGYVAEHYTGGGWRTTVYDLDDASDYLFGTIEWYGAATGGAVDHSFDINGAANVLAWELGDFPAGGGTAATTVEPETTWGITPAVGTDTEYARQDHTHGTPAEPTTVGGGVGPLLIEDTPAGSPLVFADLLQNEEGTDLLYADIV